MTFDPLPRCAAWLHHEARSGFEVVYCSPAADGWRLEGRTAAVEAGVGWTVDYDIVVDARWATRRATVSTRSAAGTRSVTLEADGGGRWTVDGAAAPALTGCRDVDLEASACTNTLPVHRMQLAADARTSAPAVYVRAIDATVERLQQTYTRRPGPGLPARFGYTAPAFDFECELTYDRSGLVLDYPGIAVRSG